MTESQRLAFSTLAFLGPLARAASLGRDYGYQGIELRLIDGNLIDPSMPAAAEPGVERGDDSVTVVSLTAGAWRVRATRVEPSRARAAC